jgi:uncharacterized protein YkwD
VRSKRVDPPVLLLVAIAVAAGIAGAWFLVSLARSSPVGPAPLTGPTATSADEPLYRPDDPWRAYLADEQTCPGGEDASLSPQRQVDTMVCLIDYARAHVGLTRLPVSATLSRSARLKGEEILRCGVFAHSPCGDDPGAGVRGLGYSGAFGENLYVADGPFAAPRVALDHWLNSPEHRENLLRPLWRVQSVYVVKVASFREYRDGEVWVSHFGDR